MSLDTQPVFMPSKTIRAKNKQKPSDPSERYTIQDQIGDGKTATVFSATHPDHGTVAIKVFHKKYAYNCHHELQFLFSMQGNPHFTTVFDTWEDNEHSYIAMELLDCNLHDSITQGMSSAEVLECTKQLSTALAQLHAKQIIHFDLKPENIGVKRQQDGSVLYKILDFGMSETFHTVFSNTFQHNINTGKLELTTPSYAAYEAVLLHENNLHTDKSDVWALGAIVYEMLTGDQLFAYIDTSKPAHHNETVFQRNIQHALTVYTDYEILRTIMELCLKTEVCDRVYSHQLVKLF